MRVGLASLILVTVLVGGTPAHAGTRHEKCRYQSVQEGKWTEDEVRWTIRCAADHFGVDRSTAMFIARRESGLHWWARNRYSGACGIFQHLPVYFEGRLDAVPSTFRRWNDSCYNARSNILAAMWMAHVAGWGAWGG